MKKLSWLARRREITYRVLNTTFLRLLHGLYRWYGLAGTFHVDRDRIVYVVEGVKLEFYFREFGCTGNADAGSVGENETRDLLFNLLPNGGVFYDIGSHEGTYTLTCGARRPDVTVYSFEPLAERLKRHLILNRMSCDRVEEVAVGDSEGMVSMVTNERSKNHVATGSGGAREVRIVRLDQYAIEKNLTPPDFIKIDIEGMESSALAGAEQLLREHQPIIICEINHNHQRYGVSLGDFLKFMRGLGYDLYRHWAGKSEVIEVSELSDVRLEDLGRTAYENFWFIPKSKATHFFDCAELYSSNSQRS
ncbi:MAG: FkbM family methyltransferase [Planctomycetales bacterium]|nr:FkbM family methyltransferase [Planctomycetales bacterium]